MWKISNFYIGKKVFLKVEIKGNLTNTSSNSNVCSKELSLYMSSKIVGSYLLWKHCKFDPPKNAMHIWRGNVKQF